MILRENNSEQGGMETYIFIIKNWLAAETCDRRIEP